MKNNHICMTNYSNCKIKIKVNDRIISGRVSHLSKKDLSVEITSPYQRITTSIHIPYFAIKEQVFVKDGKPTEYACKEAQKLLREIYETCVIVDSNKKRIQTLLGPGFDPKKDIISDKKHNDITNLIGIDLPYLTLENALKGLL